MSLDPSFFQTRSIVDPVIARVEFNRIVPTREYYQLAPRALFGADPRTVFVFHSEPVMLQLIVARAIWHDERQHCPTWTDAAECRCDVEERTA